MLGDGGGLNFVRECGNGALHTVIQISRISE